MYSSPSRPRGRSLNILRAIDAAHRQGLTVVGFTGRTGGVMASRCDLCLCAPVDATPLIQQIHITVGHVVCGLIETRLFPRAGETQGFNSAVERSRRQLYCTAVVGPGLGP
jgi:DNA-binding MurR/RpiR family transcriptional regulator